MTKKVTKEPKAKQSRIGISNDGVEMPQPRPAPKIVVGSSEFSELVIRSDVYVDKSLLIK